jgi:hypothetical protein
MAKKAPAKKTPAKRPARKTPVQPVPPVVDPVESSTPWRRFVLVGISATGLVVSFLGGVWSAGGIEVGPGPVPADSVSVVFDTQESEFRSLSGERAKSLRAGEIKSEADSAAWMSSRFIPKAEAAWIVLLTEEAKAFGGEQWTAEKEADHIARYAR